MIDNANFKVDLLNTALSCIGYENDDEVLLYYKIPLKSLNIGLKPLVSDSDISNFLGYVNKHKIMYVYIELVKNTESSSDEDGEGDSVSGDANDIVNEKHLVDEMEMNMNFDSLESDQEDIPKNARSRGLRNLRKKVISSGIRNNFYVGKEFANRDLAKERIRAYAVESRRNLDFKRNDKRRIKVICKGVVPTLTSKNEYVDKLQGPKHDISGKGKAMLIAVGVDANNGIYSVAYGIVGSENQYFWTWFLTCLVDDLDLFSNFNFTFITDMQKGLLPTIAKLFPSVEHRFCVRHINENMNLTCKGGDYKEMLWSSSTDWETTQKRKKRKCEIEMVKGDKLTRKGKTVTCSLCHGTGHNKRGCKATGLSDGGQMNDMPSETVSTEHVASKPLESQLVASQPLRSQHVARKPLQNKSVAKKS
nr:FAR1-related sequence 10 [Tanacetum cinerariifolium]